jgi:vacuolar iron transporter family protein
MRHFRGAAFSGILAFGHDMTEADIARYLANWRGEIDGAALYRRLAAAERNPKLSEVYRRLAEAELGHSRFWEGKLRAAGRELPPARPGWRPRLLGWLARRFGTQVVLPTLNAMEQIDSRHYDEQPEAAEAALPGQERSHARLLRTIAGGRGRRSSGQGIEGPVLAQIEGRHAAASGNALRAAVLGASDGLLSNLSLVMGVAGADASGKSILVAGVAGLLAGAFSMALGEWISVQSSRELYERQIEIEKAELEEVPEEEEEELALIYQAKGLARKEATALAKKIMSDKGTALETLTREELGIDPEELGGSPWEAAFASFVLFAIGALPPVVPFAFLSGTAALATSIVLSAAGLFLVGAGITLLTGRSVLYSGARQVGFGLAAAAVTFVVGRLIGVGLAG